MLRLGLLLPFAWIALATPAGASCPYPPEVSTRTVATAGAQIDSGQQFGHPAVSSASAGASDIGYNAVAQSTMAIDYGGFSTLSHTGADLTIYPFGSNGAGVNSIGAITDCLTFSGTTGTARAHIPIVLTGGASISWSIGGSYVPAESLDPASARITINCAAYSYGSMTLSGCDDFDLVIDASSDVDQTVELVFQFTFDDPITVQISAIVGTGVGYAANGSPGALMGTANFDIEGAMLPIYVTDIFAGGTPDVTLAATSGYDWFNPTPEPGAAASVAAAFGALVALRGRFRASR